MLLVLSNQRSGPLQLLEFFLMVRAQGGAKRPMGPLAREKKNILLHRGRRQQKDWDSLAIRLDP